MYTIENATRLAAVKNFTFLFLSEIHPTSVEWDTSVPPVSSARATASRPTCADKDLVQHSF
jgi:hypothetical protein